MEALALSAAFGKPFRLDEIRAFETRDPSLRPAQRAAIDLASQLCGADVEVQGNSLCFSPGRLRSGDFSVEIGTAGPVTSVLQAALLPALLAPGPVTLTVSGGTDVQYRPNLGYLEHVLLPYYRQFASIEMKIVRRGIFPRGNGQVVLRVDPRSQLVRLEVNRPQELCLEVVGRGRFLEEIVQTVEQNLARPLSVTYRDSQCQVLSACLWREGSAPAGSWRVGDIGVRPSFGEKLVTDLNAQLTGQLTDPRIELLRWLSGEPVAETSSADSNELAATKYLIGELGG